MNPVQPVSGGIGGAQQVTSVQSPASAQPAAGMSSASSISATSVNITMVHSQVDALLNSIGGGMENNKLLRMMIGLLIMQALLSNEQEQQQAAVTGLLDSLGMGAADRQSSVGIHSATNVVQIQQQSVTLSTSQAVVGSTGAEGDPQDSGSQIDLSA